MIGNIRTLDDALRDRDRFCVVELGRLAKLTQDRDAVAAAFQEEVGHAVQRGIIDPTILMEGRRGDGNDSFDVARQSHDLSSFSSSQPTMRGQMLAMRPPSTRMTEPVT